MGYVCEQVTVSVPATSANLGPGFDALGLALDYRDTATFTLLDHLEVTEHDAQTGSDVLEGSVLMPTTVVIGGTDTCDNSQIQPYVQVEIEGEGESTLPRDERNLVVRTFFTACDRLGLPRRALKLEAHNQIPQSRGMGSSAEAIVTGVTAAAAFAGLDGEEAREFIFQTAAEIEGHPDNVAPAVFGGLTASWQRLEASDQAHTEAYRESSHTESSRTESSHTEPLDLEASHTESLRPQYHSVRYQVRDDVHVWVIIPDYTLSTKAAREALPESVPRTDALLNVSRATLLAAALVRGTQYAVTTLPYDQSLLLAATEDTLHQRYRKDLMLPSWNVMQDLRQAGYASTISGAGPCVLVMYVCDDQELLARTDQHIRDIVRPFAEEGAWRVIHPSVDTRGVQWQTVKEV